jgi:predicted TIM-barrel fold metal-dependent hydrolase
MSDVDGPLIDASVQTFFRSDAELRTYLAEPFRSRGYPHVDVSWYSPGVRYAEGTSSVDGSHPGSDPEVVGRTILDERGFDIAILHPMTAASILPDWHLGSAILAATNQMLVERWLDSGSYAERFRGTIRVNPRDIEGAVKEIQRYADHPRVVQIGLPMQTEVPYGRPQFKPLWRAAVEANMPVAVHIEMGVGITHPPTPSGITRTFSHLAAYQPMTYVWHLLNMIAEGVFAEFPDLKVVWADGAADMLTPFSWRFDTFGRPHLEQTPWAPEVPSSYLAGHVHFVHSLMDGPGNAEFAAEWLRMTGKEDMLMFGSSYPSWQMMSPDQLPTTWTDSQRAKVLGGTAAKLYGIAAAQTARA